MCTPRQRHTAPKSSFHLPEIARSRKNKPRSKIASVIKPNVPGRVSLAPGEGATHIAFIHTHPISRIYPPPKTRGEQQVVRYRHGDIAIADTDKAWACETIIYMWIIEYFNINCSREYVCPDGAFCETCGGVSCWTFFGRC